MNLLIAPTAALFWLTTAISIPLLLLALLRAPWKLLIANHARQHFFYGAMISLGTLWLMQFSVRDNLAFHPILMTVVSMIFGWSFALLIGAGALVVLKLNQFAIHHTLQGWDMAMAQLNALSFPVDFCLSVVVPVGCATCAIWLVNRWEFKNPFTYFLGVGFFGAMFSICIIDVIAFLLFSITNAEAPLTTLEEQFFTFLLLTFPEGFVNGTIATALTVLWPDIVKTYRDDLFLEG